MSSAVAIVVLALPLLAVILVPALTTGATVWIYTIGFVADVAGAVSLFITASGYARRARRGELFAIPFVTPIVDRFFRPGTED